MTYAKEILSQMPRIYKPQSTFMCNYFDTLSRFQGRATLTNLYRYGGPHHRTASRWFHQHFNYIDFNQLCLAKKGILEHSTVLAIDETFGKKKWEKDLW